MAKSFPTRILDGLASLRLTLGILAVLMILVVACTLAQVHLGTYEAVERYMRAWFVTVPIGEHGSLPVFPGGALTGLALLLNLGAAFLRRFTWSPRTMGLWIVHLGLMLLVVGEFVTGAFQIEHTLTFEEGQTVDYLERPRHHELAVIDTSDPTTDNVHAIPEALLERGGDIPIPGTPLRMRIRAYHRHAELTPLAPGQGSPAATAGIGTSIQVQPKPPVVSDEAVHVPALLVEPLAGNQSLGTWLTSPALGAPQSFLYEGRTYRLELRPQRTYLPFRLTLKDFRHDLYPGTQIPKNFSSWVHLDDPSRGESRDVLIAMNQPLRYRGLAFYQASFGKDDTLSVLQVVKNPGWLIPYLSCILVTLGLLGHFAQRRWRPRKESA